MVNLLRFVAKEIQLGLEDEELFHSAFSFAILPIPKGVQLFGSVVCAPTAVSTK